MYLKMNIRDGTITAHLLIDTDERSGLTYRNQIRARVHCPLVGSVAVAALVGPHGHPFPELLPTQCDELERQLSDALRPVADEAVIRARTIREGIIRQGACHAR